LFKGTSSREQATNQINTIKPREKALLDKEGTCSLGQEGNRPDIQQMNIKLQHPKMRSTAIQIETSRNCKSTCEGCRDTKDLNTALSNTHA
jgi:hypothetical protein